MALQYNHVQTLTGLNPAWDTAEGLWAKINASGNINIALAAATGEAGLLFFYQDAGGSKTLTVNGAVLQVNPAANTGTLIGYAYDGSAYHFDTNYGTSNSGPVDNTPPAIDSIQTTTSTTIEVVFTKSVTATTAGWSFKKNGANLPIVSLAGSGTTWIFTVGTMAIGDTLLFSYNDVTGNTVALNNSSNELLPITDSVVVNNLNSQWLTYSYRSGLVPSNNGLKKSISTSGFDVFARSVEVFGVGQYLQFREGNNSTGHSQKMAGFTTTETPNDISQLVFGIYLHTDGNVYKAEGATYTAIGTYAGGDYFRVVFDSTVIRYQKASDGVNFTTLNTSGGTPGGKYYGMVSIHAVDGELSNIGGNFTGVIQQGTVATWTGKSSGVTEELNGLVYAGSSAFGNVARSTQQVDNGKRLIFSLDGQASGNTKIQRMLGLCTTTSFTGYSQMNFGMYIYDSGTVWNIENGSPGAQRTTIAATDWLGIYYNGSGVDYQKSTDFGATWATFFTSPNAPSGSYYACADFNHNGTHLHEVRIV